MNRKKPVDASIGQRLRELRLDRTMSRRELARRLGVTQRMVRYYEAGWVHMSIERIGQCAKALGCQSADLLTKINDVPMRGMPAATAPDRSRC
jgi:transcriptional regulator with XRE-family HTH domain